MYKNKRYYALVARNCVAVFDGWYWAETNKKYAVKPQFKKFDTFYEAEAYALEQFAQHYPAGYPPICRLECNQIVFTKHQRPENVMEAVQNKVSNASSELNVKELLVRLGVKEDFSEDNRTEYDFDNDEVDDGKYHIVIN